MSNAKFIKNIDNKEYLCNICSEQIQSDKIISLKCDPKKHIFCYDCIFDWYSQLNKKKNTSNYPALKICPICRKNGGLLPVYANNKLIKNIHIMDNIKNNIPKTEVLINPDKKDGECGAKLKTKGGFCTSVGKYNGFCKKHTTVIIEVKECGAKLKSKDGFCKAVGQQCYSGFCGMHKPKINVTNQVLPVPSVLVI